MSVRFRELLWYSLEDPHGVTVLPFLLDILGHE